MRAMESRISWGRTAGLTLGVSALFFTVACSGSRELPSAAAQQLTTNQAGVPVVVSCAPDQRTLVRQAVVNGAAVSQVECVAVAQAPQPPGYAPQPVSYAPPPAYVPPPAAYAPLPAVAEARRAPQPVYSDGGDARIVSADPGPARPVRTSQTVYETRRAEPKRSVKKSAIIIGSSAGVGAGVGAAVGGKKGALIGAAIGGGGATVWDQVTRRK